MSTTATVRVACMVFLIASLPVCFADTINIVTDKNGNIVTGDGFYRVYNSFNQLWKVYNGSNDTGKLLAEYTYHPLEERILIRKVYYPNESLKETTYYISEEFVRVKNHSGTFDYTYVKHEGQRVAELDPYGNKKYIHPDHLGSTALITDSSGNGVENTSYTPYGMILEGGQKSRYSYEGQEYDSTVDQYDFHFRGYKAEWGIFAQPDTLVQNVYDPQSLNRYSFERNNPYRYTDESGHALNPYGVITGIIIAMILVGVRIAHREKRGIDSDIVADIQPGYTYEPPLIEEEEPDEDDPLSHYLHKKDQTYVPPSAKADSSISADLDFSGGNYHYEASSNLIQTSPQHTPSIAYDSFGMVLGTSGLAMRESEWQRNMQTVSSGNFVEIRPGVYKQTYTEKRGGQTWEFTRIVYT